MWWLILVPIAVPTKGSQAHYKWKLALVHSIDSPKFFQARRKQPLNANHFVAPSKLSQALHKLGLTLACTSVSPKRLQTQKT